MKEILTQIQENLKHDFQAKIDEDVQIVQDEDIVKTSAILIELNIPEEQSTILISKYWDLKPSEAKSYLNFAKKKFNL